MITVKIDATKVDKSRLFEGKPDRQTGKAPKYLDLVLIPRKEVGRFGETHIVKQSKRKDENVDLPIIGSATVKEYLSIRQPNATETTTVMNDGTVVREEDVPF